MALPAVVLALLVPGGGCNTDACHERLHRYRCADGIVAACIDRAAMRWNVDRWLLRRRAWCESRMDPGAYNTTSGASGLFQFLPSTWQRTPYAGRSVWSAKWSSLAAAWMQRMGHGNEWTCQ
jgi:soluble lytic murein transglycosylase-like protein